MIRLIKINSSNSPHKNLPLLTIIKLEMKLSLNQILKIITIGFVLLNVAEIKSSEHIKESIKSDEMLREYIRRTPSYGSYILGPGDIFKLKVSEQSDFLNQSYKIDGDGIVNLKRLKRVNISGLNIEETTKILNHEYRIYVKEPDVQIEILNYRPIRVFVNGAVERPGLYSLPGAYKSGKVLGTKESINIPNNYQANDISSNFPTLFDSIQIGV